MKPGDRIGAILSADQEEVRLLGYGVYDGELPIPPEDFGLEHEPDLPPILNPHLTLDDGTVVRGCQCWWGSEARVKRTIGDRRVVAVGLDGKVRA